MLDFDKICKLKGQLEDLGCIVIVWNANDMPAATEEGREEQFQYIESVLEDRSIEFGNDIISDEFGFDSDDDFTGNH
jgi:hypothetical protein